MTAAAPACARHPAACSCAPAPHLAALADVSGVRPGLQRSVPGPRRPDGPADTLILGAITTMDPANPTADALAVRAGRIVAIGTRHDVEGVVDASTHVLDLGEGALLPGFIEPHMHYWAPALMSDWVDCSPIDGNDFAGIVDGLAAARPSQGGWTLGKRYDPSLLPDAPALDRRLLDRICPERPMLVMNASMHYAYVNSRALELAGLDDETPDPDGGVLGRDPDGHLDGALGEIAAIGLVVAAIPILDAEAVSDRIVDISRLAASRGVTRTHDAATGALFGAREPGLFDAVKSRLGCRVSFAVLDQAADALVGPDGLRPFAGDDLVRATHWKFITDGSNQGYSGYQVDPYLHRDDRGEPNYSSEELESRMRLAMDAGWPLMVHANGDAAIAQTIDCYRAAQSGRGGGRRDRIEHCSFPTDANLDDMAELGLSPSFLINHVHYWGRAFRQEIVGEPKAERLDPMASALGRNLRPTVHSDYTVTDMSPLSEVQTAVTRREWQGGEVLNPAERVDVTEALRLVTVNAAWQLHADDDIGSLSVGKYADLVHLSAHPAEVDPETIRDIEVLGTLVGGEDPLG